MRTREPHGSDYAVIGGGLVGAAVAYGLAKRGLHVTMFDQGDHALRASRGNFGLVWVQGKGDVLTDYAPWARRAGDLWRAYAADLQAETGVDLELEQRGGLFFCQTAEELDARITMLERLRARSGLDFDVMTAAQAGRLMPGVSSDAVGATFSREDGHTNPLKLLKALHMALRSAGGRLRLDSGVERIEERSGSYRIRTAKGTFSAGRVVLAAGLGNVALAEGLGIPLPIKPIRGQILVTERHAPVFTVPSEGVRQTHDGTFLLGGSWEDAGYDVSTTAEVMQAIARKATNLFPFLKKVRLVRGWAALRVIAPDHAPIYHELRPGAFLVTCHSGVSLAPLHTHAVAGWIAEGSLPAEAAPFSLQRFAAAPRVEALVHG